MKIALFVDFDNVYTGLRKISVEAAERFSRQPLAWVQWLTSTALFEDAAESQLDRRRILVRRCYLNPVPYQRYRRPFHEAGFEIVDCPPMTATGKTSTDIHLVLDSIDALQDATHFDEFVIFSADADFSPLLRRLRRHDRRTVVFAAGAMSESYKASADRVIDIQTFLRDALQLAPVEDEEEVLVDGVVVDSRFENSHDAQVAEFIRQRVLHAESPIQLPALAQLLQREFPRIREGSWLGSGSFLSLLRQLKVHGVEFDFEGGSAFDRERMAKRLATQPQGNLAATVEMKSETSQVDHAPETHAELRREAEAIVKKLVSESAVPVHHAVLAQVLRRELPGLGEGWAGASTFGGFLRQLQLNPLEQATLENGTTMVLYDPARHPAPAGVVGDKLVLGMLRAAEIPEIKASDFARILGAARLHMGNAEPFEISLVSRQVAQTLVNEGLHVSARKVASVLQALIFGGLDPKKKIDDLNDLLVDAMGVVLGAWSRETQTDADDDARSRLVDWIASAGIQGHSTI